MHGLLGDVDRLVHMQVHLFVPHAHQTFPGDDDPVLGPMPVTLQGKRGSGIDLDPLDLEALAQGQGLIPAPGAVQYADADSFYVLYYPGTV